MAYYNGKRILMNLDSALAAELEAANAELEAANAELEAIEAGADNIIKIQNELIGGESV